MFENLGKLYRQFGGFGAVLKSGYFWVAIILCGISYDSVLNKSWADLALSVMPSLTGFTIAAFAIIFAILDEKMLHALTISDDSGRSPMASIAAAIGHAVLVQVLALILAIGFKTVDLSDYIQLTIREMPKIGYSPESFILSVAWAKGIFSALGLFCTYYGVILVLAAILSIFRMQLIVANAKKVRKRPDKP